MSRYIVWGDVVMRYPSINKVGGASEVSSAYLGYVEYQIDGLLAPSFTIPFSNNNMTVKDLCVELAYARIGNLKVEESKQILDEVMSRIKRLNAGEELMLLSDGTSLAKDSSVAWSTTQDYHPTFGVSDPIYWMVDSSQVYDEETARGRN